MAVGMDRTGDLGRREPDGTLAYVGRRDDMTRSSRKSMIAMPAGSYCCVPQSP